MIKPKVTLFLPGLHWNHQWQANHSWLISQINIDCLLPFFFKGQLSSRVFSYSELLWHYVWRDLAINDFYRSIWKEDPIQLIIASPVSQELQLHKMIVRWGSEGLSLNLTEAKAFCEMLSHYYAADGLQFFPFTQDIWLLKSNQPLVFSSLPPCDLPDLVTDEMRIQGKDAWLIERWQSEIQMLLSSHPINKVRSNNQLFPINGLCLWRLPSRPLAPISSALLLHSKEWAWLTPQAQLKQEEILYKLKLLLENGQSVIIFSDALDIAKRFYHWPLYQQQFSWWSKVLTYLLERLEQRLLRQITLVSPGRALALKPQRRFTLFHRKLPSYAGQWPR